jgi:hypothetical protein
MENMREVEKKRYKKAAAPKSNKARTKTQKKGKSSK